MNLGRVDRSAELSLPEGSIVVNQMECIVEVLMKFEPSLQLKTRTTPGNQESFATQPKFVTKKPTAAEECRDALHALIQDEIVEIDAAQKNPKLHYNSEQNVINLPAIVGCLNWIALRTRPDIAWAMSRAASLITHDLLHLCQGHPSIPTSDLGICPPICSNTSRDKAQIFGDAHLSEEALSVLLHAVAQLLSLPSCFT